MLYPQQLSAMVVCCHIHLWINLASSFNDQLSNVPKILEKSLGGLYPERIPKKRQLCQSTNTKDWMAEGQTLLRFPAIVFRFFYSAIQFILLPKVGYQGSIFVGQVFVWGAVQAIGVGTKKIAKFILKR